MTMGVRSLVANATVLAGVIGCSDSTGPRTLANSVGVIVSAPVRLGAASTAASGRASAAAASAVQLVYVSLPPDSVPTGVRATITDHATGLSTTTPVINGGFDPVPIVASVGDTLTVVITGSGPPVQATLAVAAARPLKIVRTSPPSGGRDVPLNAFMVVVFSEPIDPRTLGSGVGLRVRDTVSVSGGVAFADPQQVSVAFQPGAPLVPFTTYQFVVTQAIRDLNGIALDSAAVVTFTTGAGVAPILMSIWPCCFAIVGGPGFTLFVHGSGFVSGSVVNFAGAGQATTFVDTSDLTAAVPANAIVAMGTAQVSVTNPTPDGGTSNTLNFLITSGPPLAIQPLRAMVILGDTTRLVATLRDSAGNVVPGLVVWRTSAPNVASVSSTGLITGTGLGHAFVWAFSGRDSVAANVWVQSPGPAAPPSGRIAFVNWGQLYIVNVDGSGLMRVTNDAASYSRPAWSPDAARIGAVRNGQGVVVMNVDGSGAVLVAPGGVSPAWTVDGARVRYAKVLPDSLVEIDEVTPDGSQTTTLCAGVFGGDYAHARDMDWSPDRATAAFETQQTISGGLAIFLNDDHCRGGRPLNTGDYAGSPAWSPDGQRIAFWSTGIGFSDGTNDWNVFGILANSPAGTGSPAFIFKDDPGDASALFGNRVSWSPDGKYLAFAQDMSWDGLKGYPSEIWITPGDGTGVSRRIGATGVQGWDPAWAPR